MYEALDPPVPRHPPCPKCAPHEAHVLPCDRCGCTATHPYGTWED